MEINVRAIFFFIILFISACSDYENVEEKFKFNDPGAQEELILELKKQKINYRIDDDGWIWYRLNQRNQFNYAVKQILNNYFVPETSTSYADAKIAELFKNKLEAQGIEYEIREQNNRIWIVWEQKDNEKVLKIKNEIYQIILRE